MKDETKNGIRKRYIAVIGAGRCDETTAAVAEEVGRLLAEAGRVVVCGGMGGVMEAACHGAKKVPGITVGILPGLDRSEGNRYLDISICTGIGHARNLSVVSTGDAVIAVGGEFGTLSEIGLARKAGRQVILLGSWEIRKHGELPEGVIEAASPEDAVELALKYST